ncbi:MAG: hypothetical protein ACUVXI_17285 [bacterium]
MRKNSERMLIEVFQERNKGDCGFLFEETEERANKILGIAEDFSAEISRAIAREVEK